jgi:hypothetical protein
VESRATRTRLNSRWPREESNLRPQIRSSGPNSDRPRHTETIPSVEAVSARIVAFVISAHLGGSGGPIVAPASVETQGVHCAVKPWPTASRRSRTALRDGPSRGGSLHPAEDSTPGTPRAIVAQKRSRRPAQKSMRRHEMVRTAHTDRAFSSGLRRVDRTSTRNDRQDRLHPRRGPGVDER